MPVKTRKTIAQASLEYLLTYGWALILIATVVGVLVLIAGGGVNKNFCTTTMHLICNLGTEGDTVIVKLKNATGYGITINPFTGISFNGRTGYAIINFQGKPYRFENVTIPKGQEFEITAIGLMPASQFSVTYTETETGFTRTENIPIGVEAPPGIELRNDGIDNDGIPGVDCRQTGTADCEYIAEATTGAPCTTSPCTFTFGKIKTTIGTDIGNTGAGEPVWKKRSVTFVFYAENITGSPTATITHESLPSGPQIINLGWNFIKVDMPVPPVSEKTQVISLPLSDITLTKTGSFTVLKDEAHKPTAIVNLN